MKSTGKTQEEEFRGFGGSKLHGEMTTKEDRKYVPGMWAKSRGQRSNSSA